MQQNELILLFGFAFVMVVLFGLIIYFQNRHLKSLIEAQKPDESVNIIGQWMQEMRGSIDRTSGMIQQQLNMTQEAVSSRLDNTAQLMRLLNRDLGQIHEIGQQMRDFQKIFRSPKLRGNVGESILKDLLYQILPKENVKLQHRFRN
ncbi:MAG: DNA recombination protein RmuC, partial [Actinobacteria bacterium]|nr:DNA recombination protein RmuC [Actinomycetota bacterium]